MRNITKKKRMIVEMLLRGKMLGAVKRSGKANMRIYHYNNTLPFYGLMRLVFARHFSAHLNGDRVH
jgi:hypothetical protein